jgi:hypothetical protein
MWTKILGITCAGIFVGAAIMEYAQLERRKRAAQRGEPAADPPHPSPGEPGDEPAPTTA